MAYLLAIETSTEVCSVAISDHHQIIFERIHKQGVSHASLLGVFVAEAMEEMRRKSLKINAVAVSLGPGSYTGLRIGVSEAKGLCYGLDIPLIAVPTLQIIAAQAIKNTSNTHSPILLCPMIDARRMEVYTALYDTHLEEISPAEALIVNENAFQKELENSEIVFCGNGSDKCRSVIQSPHARFLENIYPTATAMIPLAEQAFERRQFVDTAYFEPFYLKEFLATTAKNTLNNLL